VIAVEGNAESVPKIRITEKHFAGVGRAKSADPHPKKELRKANQEYAREQYYVFPILTVNWTLHIILLPSSGFLPLMIKRWSTSRNYKASRPLRRTQDTSHGPHPLQ